MSDDLVAVVLQGIRTARGPMILFDGDEITVEHMRWMLKEARARFGATPDLEVFEAVAEKLIRWCENGGRDDG